MLDSKETIGEQTSFTKDEKIFEVSQSIFEQGSILKSLLNQIFLRNDFLSTSFPAHVIDYIQSNIDQDTLEHKAINMYEVMINFLRNNNSKVDLKILNNQLHDVIKMFNAYHYINGLFLLFLQANKQLLPIKEIHWRVDRNNSEYTRRFGFNVIDFLQFINPDNKQKVLVEFGHGSGVFKKECHMTLEGYNMYGICDRLYYPLQKLFYNLIDFDLLAEEIKHEHGYQLSDEDKEIISEFLYKCTVIKKDELALDNFDYDRNIINKLSNNLFAIGIILSKKTIPTWEKNSIIPSTISTRDDHDNVIYPYKITENNRSEAFLIAKTKLIENWKKYISEEVLRKVYSYVPAFTPGIIIADFREITKLKDQQIDVGLGVRSTVYLKNKDYINFIVTLTDKLTQDGIYFSDDVRDNDGYYYRLAELYSIKNKIDADFSIKIILGPCFPGEDYMQKHQGLVPLAVIITRDYQKIETIKNILNHDQFRIVDLSFFANNKNYVAQLDKNKLTLNKLKKHFD